MTIVNRFVNRLQTRVERRLVLASVRTQKMGDVSRLFLYPDEIKDVKCQVDIPLSPLRLLYFTCCFKWLFLKGNFRSVCLNGN